MKYRHPATPYDLDVLAFLFLRYRLRALGVRFEDFACADDLGKLQALHKARLRLRDWHQNPRLAPLGGTICLN